MAKQRAHVIWEANGERLVRTRHDYKPRVRYCIEYLEHDALGAPAWREKRKLTRDVEVGPVDRWHEVEVRRLLLTLAEALHRRRRRARRKP